MKLFRKMTAILLLAAVALLPAAGLGEGTVNAFDTLRVLMEAEFDEELPVAQGDSIYTEVDEDTSRGLLCRIVYGSGNTDSSIMISGINGDGRYEIRTYSGLSGTQILYIIYLICKDYSFVRTEVPADAQYTIEISLGEGEENTAMIDSEEKAEAMTRDIREALGSAETVGAE